MRGMILLAIPLLVAQATAGAGTMYITFDGDDGSGSSLPAGVTFGTDGGGSNTFTDDQLEMGGGAWMDFGAFLGASFTAEFTIQGFGDLAAGLGAADGIFAFQTREEGCLYPGGLFSNAPAYPGVASMGFSESCALAGFSDPAWGLEVPADPGDLATVRLVVDHDADTVDIYVAYGSDATTPSQRAANMTHAATYPWGAWWSTEAAHLYIMNWLGVVVIDDVIIEGENVADFGPPVPGGDGNGEEPPPAPEMPVSGMAGLAALGLAFAALAVGLSRRGKSA